MAVKKNDKVTVEYEGKLETGEVFDSSEKAGKPLDFVVGENHVIKGFEEGIIGMEKGQEKEVVIESKDAYGERKEELMQEVPKDSLPKEQEPKAGMVLLVSTPDGRQMPVTITKVTDKGVIIDFNHPLAGKKLIFKIKLLEISSK